MAQLVPPSLSCGPVASTLEVRLRIPHGTEPESSSKAGSWFVLLANSAAAAAQPVAVDTELASDGSGSQQVTIRTKVRPETPGVLSLIVYALTQGSSPPAASSPCDVHAIAPLLVAPNAAVQQEMGSVFDTMQAVVQQQLQASTQDSRAADLQDTARQLTWSLHYEQLLWDIQTILHTTAAKPGCLPAEVAAGVLTGVLEFLGLHDCWCSISWLLAEAIRAKLLKHARAAATQRLHETQPFVGLGGQQATGAMCAGFIADLAGTNSPCRTQASVTAVDGSPSPVPISRSRQVLNAIGTASAAAAAPAPCSKTTSSSSGAAVTYHSIKTSTCDGDSCSSTSGSSFRSASSSVGGNTSTGREATQLQRQARHAAARRGLGGSFCQAWNIVLAVTAAVLVLLLLLLNSRQVLPCQAAAVAQPGYRQLDGCVCLQPPSMVPGAAQSPAQHVGVVYDELLYVPFMALLLLAVSAASRVCLVL